jgi:ABC-type bacteriocin/lantibiotic exporter with double-glycine peptidase domain
MKLVKQRGEDDCGVACVAMLAAVPYHRAKRAIFGDGEIELTHASELKDALRLLGRCTGRGLVLLRSRNFRTLTHPALLKVNPRKQGLEWHWVVWTGKKLLDPKRPPYPVWALRPVAYLRVD